MSREFAYLTISQYGSSLVFAEMDSAGPGVPFAFGGFEEASAFLKNWTDRATGLVFEEWEQALKVGAVCLGFVEPNAGLGSLLKDRRYTKSGRNA